MGALVVAGTAQAADMAARAPVYKAPVAAAPAWSWTGFYVGASVGGGWARSSAHDDPSSPNLPFLDFRGTPYTRGSGLIGGVQGGFNWQTGGLVLGAEADYSWANINSSVNNVGPNLIGTYNSAVKSIGTVRGRAGWAVDRVLFYGTGGYAYANVDDSYVDITVGNPNNVVAPGRHRQGWTAGGGIEWAFADHWTAKAEYLHIHLNDGIGANPGYVFAFKDTVDIARAGINYKF